MKPVIAINCDLSAESRRRACLNETYIDSVERAGGIPLLVTHMEEPADVDELLERADGLLLTGGDDIDPARWGEARHSTTDVLDPRRERTDFLLVERADRMKIPILGVCCGMQLLNVHRGGSLLQDIPDLVGAKVTHRLKSPAEAAHPVDLAPGTRMAQVLGSLQPRVNSAHHQAVNQLGRGLRICGRAPDGVVEALEDEDASRFLLAVQWHPERILDWPGQLALFRALVDAAAARKAPEVTAIPI